MRVIAGIIILALLGWCAWWFVGSNAQKDAWNLWFDDRQTAGWVAERSDVSVRGFPNRFDTTISDFQLADTRSGWAWSAPFFQLLMLSYKPNHVIAVWPDTQRISGPTETFVVNSQRMRGSVVFVPNTDLTLDKTQIEIEAMQIEGGDWSAEIDAANFATRRMLPGDAPDFAHQIGLEANRLLLSDSLKDRVDPSGILPNVVDRAHVDMTAAFDAPWDRHSIEGDKPKLTALSVKNVEFVWGKLSLRLSGALDVDEEGFPAGELNVQARNWQEMLNLAVATGVISTKMADTAQAGLQLLSALGGDGSTLNVPLNLKNRSVFLGPIPLGPAPNLHMR